jgi:hypothetical protein
MVSINLGDIMWELGRSLVHDEDVALISDWISKMEGNCNS